MRPSQAFRKYRENKANGGHESGRLLTGCSGRPHPATVAGLADAIRDLSADARAELVALILAGVAARPADDRSAG
jgi:hypothetical protein